MARASFGSWWQQHRCTRIVRLAASSAREPRRMSDPKKMRQWISCAVSQHGPLLIGVRRKQDGRRRAPTYGPNVPGREWYGPSLFRAPAWWRETYRKDAEETDPFFITPDGERIQVMG